MRVDKIFVKLHPHKRSQSLALASPEWDPFTGVEVDTPRLSLLWLQLTRTNQYMSRECAVPEMLAKPLKGSTMQPVPLLLILLHTCGMCV